MASRVMFLSPTRHSQLESCETLALDRIFLKFPDVTAQSCRAKTALDPMRSNTALLGRSLFITIFSPDYLVDKFRGGCISYQSTVTSYQMLTDNW